MLTATSRLPDPLVASVIFTPAPRNQTPSSVTAGAGLAEALALEWILGQDDESIARILRARWRDIEEVKRLLSALCGQLELAATRGYAPVVTPTTAPAAQVPPRNFPFAEHFDLLRLPVVEGMSFDVDDFVQH